MIRVTSGDCSTESKLHREKPSGEQRFAASWLLVTALAGAVSNSCGSSARRDRATNAIFRAASRWGKKPACRQSSTVISSFRTLRIDHDATSGNFRGSHLDIRLRAKDSACDVDGSIGYKLQHSLYFNEHSRCFSRGSS